MAFILVEHESKPIKLKGNRVVLATISPLNIDELKTGQYVGIKTGLKVELMNFGGFIGYTSQAKKTAYLAKETPATLDEMACTAANGDVFVLVDRINQAECE